MDWNLDRLKMATIAPLTAKYKGIAETEAQIAVEIAHPELFYFSAISIGDDHGQACIIPLDESSKTTAELILRAIAAYKGE